MVNKLRIERVRIAKTENSCWRRGVPTHIRLCPVFQWMDENYDTIEAARVSAGRAGLNWRGLARDLADRGLVNPNGVPPDASSALSMWAYVVAGRAWKERNNADTCSLQDPSVSEDFTRVGWLYALTSAGLHADLVKVGHAFRPALWRAELILAEYYDYRRRHEVDQDRPSYLWVVALRDPVPAEMQVHRLLAGYRAGCRLFRKEAYKADIQTVLSVFRTVTGKEPRQFHDAIKPCRRSELGHV